MTKRKGKKLERIPKRHVSMNYYIYKLDLRSEQANDRSIFANGYRAVTNWDERILEVPYYEERKYYNE